MHPTRRALLALPPALLAVPALAQGRAGRLVIGFPPGGTMDAVSRLVAERMRVAGVLNAIVDNRPGAGGRVALDAVKAMAPDGSAFVITPASMLTIYPHLYRRTLRYDPLEDFTAVSPVCVFPFGLAVNARHPARSLPEFIAWARGRQATDWASPVPGSMPHFIGTQMARAAGISLNHVPYRGSAPAMQDLLGGTIQAVLLPIGEMTAFHRAGEARILAVTAPRRLPRLDGVATFAEHGMAELTHEEWYGALLPARAPAPVLAATHEAVTAAVTSPEFREAMARIEMEPLTLAPDAFRARIAREIQAWGPIVAASGFNPDE